MECLSLSLPTCWRRRNNKRCVRDDLLLIEINSGQQMRPFRHKDTGQLRGTTWYIPSMYPAESLNSATIAECPRSQFVFWLFALVNAMI